MVRRAIRVRDLLEKMGRDVEERNTNTVFGRDAKYDRKLHHNELLEACEHLGINFEDRPAVPEMRKALRDAGHTGRTDKVPESEFSTRELLKLIRALDHSVYIEAEDVGDIWDDVAKWGGELYVNGEWREVTEKSRGELRTEQPYDSYELYYFGQNKRLSILHNLDTDECRYRHSVILEKRVNDVPYRRWMKDEYVTSVELSEPVENAGIDWSGAVPGDSANENAS